MKAVILAGGLGTRLRPVTYEIPKPLLTVKKKPIVNHLIDLFGRYGIKEIALLANREHEEDFKRWRHTWHDHMPEDKISIFYEEKRRGTFHGLQALRKWLGEEDFILANGDNLHDFDLGAMLRFHETERPLATIALVEVPNPSEYGVPVMAGYRITDFLEKPKNSPSNFISSGVYALSPAVFDYADFSKRVVMIENDIFPALAKEGKLLGFKIEQGRWYDCGSLERWEKAIKEW